MLLTGAGLKAVPHWAGDTILARSAADLTQTSPMAITTLHLTNSYHPSSGGIRTFYTALLEAANHARRYVRLVVPAESTCVEEVGAFGRIYHIAAPRSLLFDSRYRLILPHRFLLPVSGTIRQILQCEQPDLVEVCDKFSLCWLAAALRRGWIPGIRRPVLLALSCERLSDNVAAYLSSSRVAAQLTRVYLKDVYTCLFDYHIAVSRYVADELTNEDNVREQNGRSPFVQVLPHGVDVESLGPQHRSEQLRQSLTRQAGGKPGTVLLLYVGRLAKEKNLSLLLDMMESLVADSKPHPAGSSDYRLLLAGGGPERFWLESEGARRFAGHVCFLGHIGNRRSLATLLASSDIFVHPNPREPFGIAPLEAMASGLPLVAPGTGGVITYATSRNAWLADPSGEAFAMAVRSIVADPNAAKQKSQEARRTAEQHSWRYATARFFDAYDSFHQDYVSRTSTRLDSGPASPLSSRLRKICTPDWLGALGL